MKRYISSEVCAEPHWASRDIMIGFGIILFLVALPSILTAVFNI